MQLVERTLDVLLALSKEPDGLSVTELAEILNIPSSSIHRILTCLKKNHFVMQSSESKKYRLGYMVLTLSSNMIMENNLTLAAKPYMKELANKLGMTVTLCVMEDENIICLHFVESKDTSMFYVRTGIAMPPHATSAGKVIQAYMPIEQVKRIYFNNHEKVTEYTKTDFDKFLKELEEVREKGYAVSDEELQIGVQGVACPIFDYNKKPVASVAFTALKSDNPVTEENIQLLKECAQKISSSIGGSY